MYSVSERDRLRAGRCQRCRGRARRPFVDTARRMAIALLAHQLERCGRIAPADDSNVFAFQCGCRDGELLQLHAQTGEESSATSARPFSRRASHGIAMMRSLRMRSAGSWLIRFCSTLENPDRATRDDDARMR